MDMSVHRRPGAQGEGRRRLKSATIAGLVTLACLIAVPVEFLELILASVGLSELLPVLAPPIGWPVRIGLALLGAANVAAITWGRGDDAAPRRIEGAGPGTKGNGIMGWTRNLGLHHLARIARGNEDWTGNNSPTPQFSSKLRKPALTRDDQTPSAYLSRSRRDMHPDAPPRAPLFASRDLPDVAEPKSESRPEFKVVEVRTDVAPPPPTPWISPIRDTTNEIRPRPLPRSPAPLSDSDIGWVRGLIAGRNGDAAPGAADDLAAPPEGLVPQDEVAEIITADTLLSGQANPANFVSPGSTSNSADQPLVPLLSLVDRFEQGVAHRIALRDAANAVERVEELTGTPGSPAATSATAGTDAAPSQDIPLEMDDALNTALETLRKLSVKAKGR